jgi:uncharacterized protein (TIGR02145 family)
MSSIIYNGHEIQDLIVNGNQAQLWLNGQKLYPTEEPVDPFVPVTIGSQIWMSKNLSIDDGQGGIYTQTVNYGQGDVVEYYYNWDAAVRVANSIPGWHLPTADEWDTLANAVGGSSIAGTKLKSSYGWSSGKNGTDDYGFAAFPAGFWNSGSFLSLGSNAYFWTANEQSSTNAYNRNFYMGESMISFSYSKSYGYSVRLVKDA